MMNSGGKTCNTVPLFHTIKVDRRLLLNRVLILVNTCAILALLLYHHLLQLLRRPMMSLPSLTVFLPLVLADVVLAFLWVSSQAFRWRPISRTTFPEKLTGSVSDEDIPAMDVFICTADPVKEPPMDLVNTTLSVLAVDYPVDKVSVYVSDDGCSQLTLFALMEASRFAKHWLPFCKDHLMITKRCPEQFFKSDVKPSDHRCSIEDWDNIKMLYEKMKMRVESLVKEGYVNKDMISNEEERKAFDKWEYGFSRQDHPTIIQILLESNKDFDASGGFLPNLIYLSREKRKTSHHNFKAGALNVLIRVSATMTNAPMMLSLDCDTYCNDPQAPRRALCHFLDPVEGPKLAFVQFPQRYKGVNKGDIYNNKLRRGFQINARGLDGLIGANYVGTGSFLQRKAFYDDDTKISRESMIGSRPILEAAERVASCIYEQGTNWGLTMGFRYGTVVEDFFTGYRLHCEGWRSVLCDPSMPAFLSDIPISLNDTLIQMKRWTAGFLEVAFSKYCPFTYGTRSCFLMGIGYGFYSVWAFWSIPILIYAFVPQLALLNNIHLFPKVTDPWIYLYLYLFLASYIQDLAENLLFEGTLREWWNEQRMWMIRGLSSYLFAVVQSSLKPVGFSGIDFEVTSKVINSEQQERYEREIFEFGVETPLFVPLTMAALMSLISFTWGLMKLMNEDLEDMCVQLVISGFGVVISWPIYEAMVLRRDGGRMPARITLVSLFLTLVLCSVGALVLKS